MRRSSSFSTDRVFHSSYVILEIAVTPRLDLDDFLLFPFFERVAMDFGSKCPASIFCRAEHLFLGPLRFPFEFETPCVLSVPTASPRRF